MSLTVNEIITNFNSYIGDSSTDRVSAAERLQYITEATVWIQEELENDLQNQTYALSYFDTVNTYPTTSQVADLLEGSDLRRGTDDQSYAFAHVSPREIAESIGQANPESMWAIERHDNSAYLVVNHQSKYEAKLVCDFDSTTTGGGSWAVDSTNSDATNLTIDTNEFKQGNASFNFDITVAQTVNNKATIKNTTLSSIDLSQYVDLASWLMWVYLPDVTYITSVKLYWGSSTSNYWSSTVTTDYSGAAFVAGWNRVKFDWSSSTKTGTPVVTTITYLQIDINYGASQPDDTDFRIDDLILARPEVLTFYYIGWNIGTDTTGVTNRIAFSATTDIPYFSGQYDQYKFPVAHKAASLCFQNLRLFNESQYEAGEAQRTLMRAKKIIPTSKNPEQKTFKVRGVNLTKNRRR